MTDRNIFADEWRQTLRAHYIEVIRKQDTLTERTLENVMYEIGFSDADLQEMRVYAKATMRAEDMETLDDFTPDAELVSYVAGLDIPGEPDVVENAVVEELPIEEAIETLEEGFVEDDAALLDASEPELELEVEPESDEDEPPEDDAPAQLSLF